jgi:hypothetical protein
MLEGAARRHPKQAREPEMATRTQLKDMLKRRLQDSGNAQWSDDTLNLYLNFGYQYMEKEILKVDPMAFIYEDTANIVAGTAYYPMPSNAMWEVGVYTKSTSDGEYEWMDYIELPWIQAGSSPNWESNPFSRGYSRAGRYLVLFPEPTANITNGIALEYVPWLTMGADTDVPEIDPGLQEGIVFRAEEIALGDTAQEAVKAEKDLAQVITSIPAYYRRRGGIQRFNPAHTLSDYEE